MKPKPRALIDIYGGRGLPRPVRAFGLTSFLQDFASEMVFPLLPAFLASFGGGAMTLGAMESIAEAVLTLVKGGAGRASDRLRRRKPFVSAGYALSAATRPFLALAMGAPQVVALRALDRLAKGLRTAPRDAMIAEMVEPEHRGFAFSFHRGLDHLGAAVGPLAAALILVAEPGGTRLVFALATIPALAGWLSVHFLTHETAGAPAAAPAAPERRAAMPLRSVRLALFGFFLASLGSATDAFIILRASDLGFSTGQIALLWSGFHVAKWLASAPAGRLGDRLGAPRLVVAGWALHALVYCGFAFVDGPPGLIGLLLIYAVYYGLTEGSERALVARLTGSWGTGSVFGVFHFTAGAGTLLASVLFGAVWSAVSPRAAFLTGAALAGLGTVLLLLARPRDDQRTPSPPRNAKNTAPQRQSPAQR